MEETVINILSTFARVGAIDLLRRLCKSDRLHLTPATFNELRRAVEVGFVSKERVRQLLRLIETEQGMVIKNRDAIFG